MERLDLIKPTSLPAFCGNKYAIKCILDFVKKSMTKNNTEKNIIGIIGPDGCGKTTLCRLLFKKFEYNVLEIGRDNLNGDDIKTVLNNFAKNNTIDSILNQRKKVVFVDDIDILTNVDKMLLSKVLGLNKLFIDKGIMLFVTCNINDERRMQDHAKDIEIFKLYYPTFKDSYVYIMNKFDEHDIDYDPDVLLNVASKFRGNIRETVLNLSISEDELLAKHDERTFKDMNNFEVAKFVLQQKAKWKDIEVLCKCDVGIIPHIMYENLPDEVGTNYKVKVAEKGNKTGLLDMYLTVNKCFIDSLEFEECAFTSHDWSMLEYANYMKVHSIYNAICSLERKSSPKDVKYRFSQMVSKMSHKNIMNKKMKTISCSSNVSNTSIIMASDMHSVMGDEDVKAKPKRIVKKGAMSSKTDSNQFNFEEGTSIINTYQKYFGS
jgi:DNA polymerase III delta prime subunit